MSKKIEKMSKQRKSSDKRKWLPDELFEILSHMRDLHIQGIKPQHPTAIIYYEKVIKNLRIKNCKHSQLRSKINNMKAKYSLAIQWANQTGQGVEKGSIIDHQRKMCPFFDILNEIYWEKKSFNLPYLYCTVRSNVPNGNGEGSSQIFQNETVPIPEENIQITYGDNESRIQILEDVQITSGDSDRAIRFLENEKFELEKEGNAKISVREEDIVILYGDSEKSMEVVEDENVAIPDEDLDLDAIDNNRDDLDNSLDNLDGRHYDSNGSSGNFVRRDIQHDHPVILFGDEMTLEEQAIMDRNIMRQDDSTENEVSAQNKSPSRARFRKSISCVPPSSRGFKNKEDRPASNAAAVIGEALTQRAEAMSEKNKNEFTLRKEELKLEREKFEFEKEMRLKEMEFEQELQIEKLRKEERLAELKIRLEYETPA